MIYQFTESVFSSGNRAFITIPFNVWEETGLTGNIPSRVQILDRSFECKLLPKGGGTYWIPVPKGVLAALPQERAFEVSVEPIASLSRINHDSPYSSAHPIRRIDGIRTIPVPPGFCGHGCVAMLAGVPLADAVQLMGKGHASWSKILEALDYYGIGHAQRAVYTRGKPCPLPPCCIVLNGGGFLLWYEDAFCGATEVDPEKTVCYLEIPLE